MPADRRSREGEQNVREREQGDNDGERYVVGGVERSQGEEARYGLGKVVKGELDRTWAGGLINHVERRQKTTHPCG